MSKQGASTGHTPGHTHRVRIKTTQTLLSTIKMMSEAQDYVLCGAHPK